MACLVFVAIVSMLIALASSDADNLNEYDPYYNGCARIRKPWDKLSTQERNLYISGLLELRAKSNGNVDEDELIAIGSVHEDPAAFTHQTSSYLFWHGYLVWELESRIRNLGGKYKCFAMPYWDFTMEAGREKNPFILNADIGGDGDPKNYYTVNEYSWPYSVSDYWVPTNCIASNDQYPLCSLKRGLRTDFIMPSAKEVGNVIIDNPDFFDFAAYSRISGSAIHLLDDHSNDDGMTGFPQAYEPIWYLFHSAIQFHQALWTDCNQYDLINVNDLDNYPSAFTPFCNNYIHCSQDEDNEKDDGDWAAVRWELDDPLYFGGTLKEKEWSYIYNNELTVRDLYMIPKWNIKYDLGDGTGFYADSGLKKYCAGKLNRNWFVIDGLVKDNEEKEEMGLSVEGDVDLMKGNALLIIKWMMLSMFVVSVVTRVYWSMYGEKDGIKGRIGVTDYGSV